MIRNLRLLRPRSKRMICATSKRTSAEELTWKEMGLEGFAGKGSASELLGDLVSTLSQ